MNLRILLLSFTPQGGKIQTRVGLLMLLCGWTANCPIAVTHFLHNTANVPYVSLMLCYMNMIKTNGVQQSFLSWCI